LRTIRIGSGSRGSTTSTPAILDAYGDGSLFTTIDQGVEQHEAYSGLGLAPEEYAVMVIVARYQEGLAVELRKAS
jgi:hypothetical protein